ncbi:MOXD1 2-like [Vespula maculifrons]|uniref:MOXD1 2-like n=1 Tax=Vespula maculifrons TaxID=7453 RepID=A0ABD2CBP9_VESMC
MKFLALSFLLFLLNNVFCVEWKHSAILDNNFLVLWTPGDKEVTFEIQVKTLGYVGLGFKKEDGREGADMVIGWVDNNGQVHLQKFNSIVCFSSTIVFHVGAGIKSIDIVGTIGQIGAIILD